MAARKTKRDRWFERLRGYLTSDTPNDSGEYRMRCPLHNDRSPSASINFDKGVFHCNSAKCGGGGTIDSLIYALEQRDDGGIGVASYDPFVQGNVTHIEEARSKRQADAAKPKIELTESRVKSWHDRLRADRHRLAYLLEKRGLTKELISSFQIGFEQYTQRFTIPVRDAEGRLVNVRRYKPNAPLAEKMINLTGYGSPPRLYPIQQLTMGKLVLVVEGEMDALTCIRHGFHAVSGTGGALRWDPAWGKLFAGKDVVLCYDNDQEGRLGTKRAMANIRAHADSVVILDPLLPEEKSDITDWFMAGHTPAELRTLIDQAQQAAAQAPEPKEATPAKPVPVQVIGSMDSTTNGKALRMAVTITGKRNPTYSVPHIAHMECTLDAGPKCKTCPMAIEWEGEHRLEIRKSDVGTLARFIDANEDKTLDLLRKHAGIVKCNRLTAEVEEAWSVEEIFVTSSVDRRDMNGSDSNDYTQRRVYNVGSYDTPTNTTANIVGTTIPSPKDRRNEFVSWELSEATTSIDTFKVSPELVKRLSVFQTTGSPLAKCFEIAQDLSQNITKIIGRERMHIAMDLVWHSLLHFPLDGKVISRGWLEFIVVGDTRTGKSETALRLADHYGLGHVIGCEGATFAGLVGAVKQIGDAWTVTWGEITINDRRLVVLDEASGLTQEAISQLSDIRSRGIAQLTKVESQETRARCRMVWISNPRKARYVDEKKVDGIDVLEDLIGNPEDIARFDFAMSVRMGDVPGERINDPDRSQVQHVYTAPLCHELVLWAWSRKPEHVEWKPDAYRRVYELAEKIGTMYIDHPPLIQRTNVREKIARIAVALAARTFSTDEQGERVIVERRHVNDAVAFLHKLYSYENFGYLRLSKRVVRNRKIARANRIKVKKWLLENRKLLEFLLDRRGSFRAQDLEEMAYMHRDEAAEVLGRLADAKMISKEKSQIIIEPELQRLLREMEK
jgi:hypothetical protein